MPHFVTICIKYTLGKSWPRLYVHLLNICLCLPLHTPRSLHSRGQCINARSLSVNLSPSLSNVFSAFFHCMRPSNVYCWRSSCLDLGTAQVVLPQLISDPVSNTDHISIWSPPTPLYAQLTSDPASNTHQISVWSPPTPLYHN